MLGSTARVAVVAVGLAAAAASSMKEKTPEEKAKEGSEKEERRREVANGSAVDVVAGQILADYKANEIGADAKYRDRVLRVTGIIARVGKNVFDEPEVRFTAGRDTLEAVFATEAGLGTLKRSDTITVRCRGKKDFDTPKLVDCVFVEKTPAPSGSAR